MIYVLHGADDYSIHEALTAIKAGLGDAETLATNTSRLEGGKLAVAELQAAVEAFPFFGDKRLVIVDGLAGRFESKSKSTSSGARATKKAESSPAAEFAAALKSAPPSTITVLLEGELKKTNPLLKELASKAEVKEFAPLAPGRLLDWIKKRISAAGGAISDEAAALLSRTVGANLWTMSNEVDKLCLLTAGRGIEAADVEAAVAASREVSVFELVDAVMAGRSAAAQKLLQEFLRDGQSPSFILFMLARQLRLLVRAKSMMAEGCSEGFMQGKLGLPDFALRRTLEQAGRFNLARLKDFYHRLLEADQAIKTSRYDEELAVGILVAEACG